MQEARGFVRSAAVRLTKPRRHADGADLRGDKSSVDPPLINRLRKSPESRRRPARPAADLPCAPRIRAKEERLRTSREARSDIKGGPAYDPSRGNSLAGAVGPGR
jgi:hypothetical protein